jgi:Secretion system C-terminal sorting domain
MKMKQFAKNGDRYSSASGSIQTGGSFFMKNNTTKWWKHNRGLGLDIFGFQSNQIFAENSKGKVFMVQFLDERIYWTDTSLLSPTHTPSVFEPKTVNIYPNPVQKNGSIQVDLPTMTQKYAVEIIDIQGRIIRRFTHIGTMFLFDAPSQTGFYVVKIVGEQTYLGRFVVR